MKQFQFCPLCGKKLVKKDIHGRKRPVCLKCSFRYYNNPIPATTAIIANQKGEILLSKRAYQPFKGYWDIPGGFLEGEEDPAKALKREIKEELSIEIEIEKLLGIYHDIYHDPHDLSRYLIDIAFLAKIVKGKLQPADDVTEIKYFPLNKLPKFPFEHQYQVIKDYKKQL